MKFRTAAALAMLGALVGCVQTVDVQSRFDPSEYAFALKPGKASITGQGFLRRNDGIVVYGAGSDVLLIPKTAYTTEINSMQGTGRVARQMDVRLAQFVRHVQADGEGRFTFKNVPDGDYFVSTTVTWMAGDIPQGGAVTKEVIIANGQSVSIILAR